MGSPGVRRGRPAPLVDDDEGAPAVALATPASNQSEPLPVRNTFIDFPELQETPSSSKPPVPETAPGKFIGRLGGSPFASYASESTTEESNPEGVGGGETSCSSIPCTPLDTPTVEAPPQMLAPAVVDSRVGAAPPPPPRTPHVRHNFSISASLPPMHTPKLPPSLGVGVNATSASSGASTVQATAVPAAPASPPKNVPPPPPQAPGCLVPMAPGGYIEVRPMVEQAGAAPPRCAPPSYCAPSSYAGMPTQPAPCVGGVAYGGAANGERRGNDVGGGKGAKTGETNYGVAPPPMYSLVCGGKSESDGGALATRCFLGAAAAPPPMTPTVATAVGLVSAPSPPLVWPETPF
eukprot:TRINITY_DN18818_c0_g1_i2.p1 TRINITY_DN18818_c0_g1~~TRINITY_DN18818_c0_g1_i2.p1  ORF type:complete len:350 (+),score=69.58 TRINITY_DN18818_c0_g1_i2:152-1201(+)